MALFVGLMALVAYQQNVFSDSPRFDLDLLTIMRADGGELSLKVEVAVSPEQKQYGLMNRHQIDDDAGMIFVWDDDRMVSMWMKNTYVPLDMLFVRNDGAIVKIITNAEPLNLTNLSSGQTVRAVVELKAGAVQRYGIKQGDKIIYKAFQS